MIRRRSDSLAELASATAQPSTRAPSARRRIVASALASATILVGPTPAAAAEPSEAAATAAPKATEDTDAPPDELEKPGYTPGYRRHMGVGLSPYMPRLGSLPGGITPPYGVPALGEDWTFTFTGFMTAALKFSLDKRQRPTSEQNRTVYHSPPATIDEYASFVSTDTVPGHWIQAFLTYGTEHVNATVAITTWNPTRPTTYYQMGTQNFIDRMFLTYTPDEMGDFSLRWTAGYFPNSYGGLSEYSSGIYVNPILGRMTGAGETLFAKYHLSDSLTLVAEHGIHSDRTGAVPTDVVASQDNGYRNPSWPADWVHHAHLGLVTRTAPEIAITLHHLYDWSQDDRNVLEYDIPFTRQLNETQPKDGRLHVAGADFHLKSGTFGWLGAGIAYIDAKDVYTLRTLETYGGNGETLTNAWFGQSTGGNGKILVGGVNYNFSLAKILAHPDPYPDDAPDLVLNAGYHVAKVWTDFEPFNRMRSRTGINGEYTFLSWMGAGLRLDRVVPNSRDPGETFHVVGARLLFKSDWHSRDNTYLMYARWFNGPRTHKDGTTARTLERIDDQMVALNFNMWW